LKTQDPQEERIMKLSARNVLKGRVVEVESGAVNCVVKVD
jgi:molybdopterin-binding protein